MKKICLIITLALLAVLRQPQPAYAQNQSDTVVYLLTCNPGTETKSIYGHSALRIIDRYSGTDTVYDWGVFNSGTPGFKLKFAKGQLNYMLQSSEANTFLQTYSSEGRGVTSQRINLNPDDVRKLLYLINENLKPENASYQYSLFYDNCATRIRDLLEQAADGKIHYPSGIDADVRTFRDLTSEYQKPYRWLNLGINLMLGLPSDKEASFSERMFLPFELQQCFNQTVIQTGGRLVPLLQNPETVVDNTPVIQSAGGLSPEIIIALFFILIIIIMPFAGKSIYTKVADIFIFSVFSVLAVLMFFFSFFTDHQLTGANLNAVWLNPLIVLCLVSLIANKAGVIWFRLVFFISILFLVVVIVLPQEFNRAVMPMCFILVFRSSARAAFEWNPFSIDRAKQLP